MVNDRETRSGDLVDDAWLVGRHGELALLDGLLGALEAGVGGALLLEGEHGIGKSAVLRTSLTGVNSEIQVLWGAADELKQRFPLRLIAECLADESSLPQPAIGDSAAEPFELGLTAVVPADPVRDAMEAALARVERLCAVAPVVLVTEDLQWADEASLLMWSLLSRTVSQMPLLLVGSCRPGSEQEGELRRLRRSLETRGGIVMALESLGEASLAQLVDHLTGGRPGRRLAEMVGGAGGNPLYARELLNGLMRDGRVQVKWGVTELVDSPVRARLPVSLAAAIGTRLESLGHECIAVLRWAAVLGPDFSVTDLAAVTGRSAGELIGAMDAGIAAGVLAETGQRLGFRHGLIRQTLHEGMPAALRAARHVQAAQVMERAGAAPERVATQLVRALEQDGRASASARSPAIARSAPTESVLGLGPVRAWAVPWLTGAAPTLAYRAPRLAAELLAAALTSLASDDPVCEQLEANLLTVSFLLRRDGEVERLGRRLIGRARHLDRAAELAWTVGYAVWRTGRPSEAADVVAQALGRPGLSDVHRARLRSLSAIIAISAGEVEQAAATASSALDSARRAGDGFGAGHALHALATVGFLRRDYAAQLEHTAAALEVIADDPHATDLRVLLLTSQMPALWELDQPAAALAAGRQALALAGEAGLPSPETRLMLAGICYAEGQWAEALAELEHVHGLSGPDYVQALACGLAALVAGHRADWDRMRLHLSAAADPIRPPTVWTDGHGVLLARSLAAEAAGRIGEAATVLTDGLPGGAAGMMPHAHLLLAPLTRLALAASDVGLAVTAAKAAHEAWAPLPLRTAIADHCAGLISGDPGPVLTTARYYRSAGRPLHRAEALEDAAELAAAAGDLTAARRELTEAVRGYAALGAQWDISRATGRLQSYGVRPGMGSRPARPVTGWAALTPTEAKVAYLVARGLSNPDIAAELFLSRNTVQTHVSHILAKLGTRSRSEIVREALSHLDTPPDRTA